MSGDSGVLKATAMEEDGKNEICSLESCPREIYVHIFKYLEAKDLFTCRLLNRTGRSVADYCGHRYQKWKALMKYLPNEGATFVQRSTLTYLDMYMNYRMWLSVHTAQVKLRHVYDLNDVNNLHVYKDNLIAVCKDSVKFFNLKDGGMIKEISEACWDYQENDFWIVKVSQKDSKSELTLYSKPHETVLKYTGVKMYKLHNNKYFMVNYKNCIVICVCTSKMIETFARARYYSNPQLLCDIFMYKSKVFIYISKGVFLFNKCGEIGLHKVCTLDVPKPPGALSNNPTEKFIAIFHMCSVVYAVQSQDKEGIRRTVDVQGNVHLVLLYKDLTCATEHGDILLLGFNDGRVGIVIVSKVRNMNELTPSFQFCVPDVQPIQKLQVYEDEGCHHVIAMTSNKLYQFEIFHADYNKVIP